VRITINKIKVDSKTSMSLFRLEPILFPT
jgi:hypothetical protein